MKNILLVFILFYFTTSFSQIQNFKSGEFDKFLNANVDLKTMTKESNKVPARWILGTSDIFSTRISGKKWLFRGGEKFNSGGYKIKDTIIGYLKTGESINSAIYKYDYFITGKKLKIIASMEVWESRYIGGDLKKAAILYYPHNFKFIFDDNNHNTELIFSNGALINDIIFFNSKGHKIDNFNINKFFEKSIDNPNLNNLYEVEQYVKRIYKKYFSKYISCDSCISKP